MLWRTRFRGSFDGVFLGIENPAGGGRVPVFVDVDIGAHIEISAGNELTGADLCFLEETELEMAVVAGGLFVLGGIEQGLEPVVRAVGAVERLKIVVRAKIVSVGDGDLLVPGVAGCGR